MPRKKVLKVDIDKFLSSPTQYGIQLVINNPQIDSTKTNTLK